MKYDVTSIVWWIGRQSDLLCFAGSEVDKNFLLISVCPAFGDLSQTPLPPKTI